jgi:hypothetical protein
MTRYPHKGRTPIRLTARSGMILALALLASACGVIRPETSLMEQARSARSPADHAAVAQAYRHRAQGLRTEAADHAALADWWSSLASGGPLSARRASRDGQARHCRRLAEDLSAAASEAEAMAQFHEELARPPLKPE